MIEVTPEIQLGDDEVQIRAVRASGPGGQHVNKVSTAIELRFDVRASPSLPEPVRARLYRLAGSRLTQEGVLIVVSQTHRSQEMNRQDALDRLLGLNRHAAPAPPPPPKEDKAPLRLEAEAAGGQDQAGRREGPARAAEWR